MNDFAKEIYSKFLNKTDLNNFSSNNISLNFISKALAKHSNALLIIQLYFLFLFWYIIKVPSHFNSQILGHILFLHKLINIQNFFSKFLLFPIITSNWFTYSIDSISENSNTNNDCEGGVYSLLCCLWMDISVSYWWHCSEAPIYAAEILCFQIFIDKIYILINPACCLVGISSTVQSYKKEEGSCIMYDEEY